MFSISKEGKLEFFSCGPHDQTPIPPALIDKISLLDELLFPTPWSKQRWIEILKGKQGSQLLGVFQDSQKVYGFILLGISNPDSAHLYKILVDDQAQQKSLGTELLRTASRILKKKSYKSIFLEVEQSNSKALAFYRKHGYKVLVAKKDFYGAGRHAYAMDALL